MVKFSFNYNKKKFEVETQECRSVFQKTRGLMFRKKPANLLFYFDKLTKQGIHSFFCKPFIAVWFNGSDLVDMKIVSPWKFFIRPKKKFDKLLEMPSGTKEFKLFYRRGRKV